MMPFEIFISYYHYCCFRILLLACLVLLCLCRLSFAQTRSFEHLNVEQGLSQNSVLAIGQDGRGFIWMGTRYGLNRYDGTRIKIYLHDSSRNNSISDNYITSIYTDSRHVLWVGTLAGLNKYDPETDRFENIPAGKKAGSLSNALINCIYEDRKGNLWIGTANGLNLLTNRGKNYFSRDALNGLAASNIRTIYQDSEGIYWVGTSTGLTRMTTVNDGFRIETFTHADSDPASLPDNIITSITEDALHQLWIGTQNGGAGVFNRANHTFLKVPTPGISSYNIRKITSDKKGLLWIGTQEGLAVLDPITKTGSAYRHDASYKKCLSQNSIYSIFCDAVGSMWIGTYFGGANIVYPFNNCFTVWQNSEAHNSINNNVVSGITEDAQQQLWIATEGGGINYLNRATGTVTVFKNIEANANSLGSNLVKTIYRDNGGNIWAGTHGGGLNLYNSDTRQFTRFIYKANDPQTLFTEIPAILEDSRQRFWVGTQEGIKLFHRNNKNLEPYIGQNIHQLKQSVKSILEDGEYNLWVGTSNGMFILKNNADSFIKVKNFPPEGVNCIMAGKGGKIWAGLYYNGLMMYDTASSKTVIYTDKQGLPNNNILSVAEDDSGHIWMGTGNGLSRLDVPTGTFQNYTTSDGLAGNDFNYNSVYKSAKGELFFGGFSGFTAFWPDKIETNNYTAPLVFTALKLFDNRVEINGDDGLLAKDIGLANQVTFRYNQDVFTIEFALLNYIKSNKNKYACKLDGLDKTWTETVNPLVTYTHLPEGSYTLLVKGANNDGIWSKPAALHIKVLPPFWKTWWAYLMYTILIVALLFLVTRFFFLRELIKKEEALHQFKLNFFTNISHEIRTHLVLITGPLEKLVTSTKNDGTISRQLLSVKKNADRLLKLVSEQMDFRKAETGHLKLHISKQDIVAFTEDIYHSFQNVSVSRRIKSSFISDSDAINLYFDKVQLEKVLFNLLSNAYKFTPDDGLVSVLLKKNKTGVEIKVTDNGKGIAPANLEKLFDNFYQEDDQNTQNTGYGIGLALAKSIVELHHGKLTVESDTSGSVPKEIKTSFTVTLLYGHTHFKEVHFVTDDSIPLTTQNLITEINMPVNNLSADKSNAVLTGKIHTILLVEDNAEVRAFIRDSLNHHYHILEAVNGLKGWETATANIPDLIISDVMMPEMNGLTLCNQLKADERTSHIPVILLTAKSSTDNQVAGLETGADIYLTKPFSIRVLQLHMYNLLVSREKMRQRFSTQFKTDEVIEPAVTVVNKVDEQFLKKAIQTVEDYMDDPEFGVAMFSTKLAMSPPVLYKKLKAVTDMSVNDFIKSLRMQKALDLLQQGKTDAYDVAGMVGYKDKKYFGKEFKKYFGKAPSEVE